MFANLTPALEKTWIYPCYWIRTGDVLALYTKFEMHLVLSDVAIANLAPTRFWDINLCVGVSNCCSLEFINKR